jgi:hypothetical protein
MFYLESMMLLFGTCQIPEHTVNYFFMSVADGSLGCVLLNLIQTLETVLLFAFLPFSPFLYT